MAEEVIHVSGDDVSVTISDGLEIVTPGDLDASTPEKQAAFRTAIGIGAHPDGTLTQQEVIDLIHNRVKAFVETTGRAITTDDIDSSFRNTLHNAVAAGSVETTDDALTMESSGGIAVTIDKFDLAVATATRGEAEGGTETEIRSFSPQLIQQAIAALVTRQIITGAIGQNVISVTVNNGQLIVVAQDENGNQTTTTDTLGDGTGGTQAHTDDQIRNLAGALLATVMPFSYDPNSPTPLVYTQPTPEANTVARSMLTQALRDLIDAKIDANEVEEAAKTDAITEAVAQAFREKIGAASAASHQSNPLDYETRLGTFDAPQSATTQWFVTPIVLPDSADSILLTDGSNKVLVNVATNTRTTVKVSDILAQAEVTNAQAATADGLRVVVRFPTNFDQPEPFRSADDTVYYLSHNGRNLAIAPDDIGDFSGTVFANGTRLWPFADREVSSTEPGYTIPEGKLPDTARDDTLTGTGKADSPLSVANPFTDSDKTRLDGLGNNPTLTSVPVAAAASAPHDPREIVVITPSPRSDATVEMVLNGNRRRFGAGLGSVVNALGRDDFATLFVALEVDPVSRVVSVWTLPTARGGIEWDWVAFNGIVLNFAAGTVTNAAPIPWDATNPQPNYRRVVFPALTAEQLPDDWDAVPVNLRDDEGDTALQSPDGIDKQWLTGNPTRVIERLISGVLRNPVEQATYLTDQQTGDFSVSPSPSDRPEGWLTELTNLLFVNFSGELVEIALSRNVVQKSEEAFPAKLIATPAESANARVQAEIHMGGDRDDQLLRFPAFRDPVVQPSALFPNPTRTTGTTHALTPPPGWRRVTYYSDTHNSQNYAGRLVLLPTGDVVREFAPVQIALRVVGETEAQGTTIALNRDIHGVYVSNVLAAKYRPNKIDGANPPPQADVSLLANPQNGSSDGGNYQYRNPDVAENKYFDATNMGALAKPRRFFFGNAAFFTALRAVGDNRWMEFSASTGHTSLFRRTDLPDSAMCFLSLRAQDSSVMNTRMFFARDFKELGNVPAANTTPKHSVELLSGDADATSGANCYQATMQNRETVSIGWRGDRFAVLVPNASRWIDTARLELWIIGG